MFVMEPRYTIFSIFCQNFNYLPQTNPQITSVMLTSVLPSRFLLADYCNYSILFSSQHNNASIIEMGPYIMWRGISNTAQITVLRNNLLRLKINIKSDKEQEEYNKTRRQT